MCATHAKRAKNPFEAGAPAGYSGGVMMLLECVSCLFRLP